MLKMSLYLKMNTNRCISTSRHMTPNITRPSDSKTDILTVSQDWKSEQYIPKLKFTEGFNTRQETENLTDYGFDKTSIGRDLLECFIVVGVFVAVGSSVTFGTDAMGTFKIGRSDVVVGKSVIGEFDAAESIAVVGAVVWQIRCNGRSKWQWNIWDWLRG